MSGKAPIAQVALRTGFGILLKLLSFIISATADWMAASSLAAASSLLKPKGKRVVLSEGGGDNANTVDNIEIQGLEINVLSEMTQEKLKPFIL